MKGKPFTFIGSFDYNFFRVLAASLVIATFTSMPVVFSGTSPEDSTSSCKAKILHGRDESFIKSIEAIFNNLDKSLIAPSHMTPLDINMMFLTNLGNRGSVIFYGGAFFLAIDKLNEIAAENEIPVVFNWTFRDTDNREASAMQDMANLYCPNNVSVFICTDVFCKPEDLTATVFEIPYITDNCQKNHKDTGQNLMVDAEPSFAYVYRFILSVLRHNRWTSFWLVSGGSIKWQSVAKQLKINAELMNISINGESTQAVNEEFHPWYLFAKVNPYKTILEASRLRTRVYVFLGEYEPLLIFARELKALGMTDSGEYAVVSADDNTINLSSKLTYLTVYESEYSKSELYRLSKREKTDKLSALKNVLVIKPQRPGINKHFEDQVYLKSIMPPINLRTPPLPRIKRPAIPNQAYHLYDATMFYGQAVMDLMALPGANPKNATHIIYYLRCEYHKSIHGNNVWIDSNGESEDSYFLAALTLDEENAQGLRLKEVGIFDSSPKRELMFKLTNSIHWVSGHPPISDPKCGFDGKLCPSAKPSDRKMIIIIASVVSFVLIVVVIIIIGIRIPNFTVCRHCMYQHKLERQDWKIEREEIQILNPIQFREMSTPSRPSLYRNFLGPADSRNEDINTQVEKYGDPSQPGSVNNLNLHHDILAVNKFLQKEDPVVTSKEQNIDFVPLFGLKPLSEHEEEKVQKVLHALGDKISRERIMVYPYFKDYDQSKASSSVVTPSQFSRKLHFLGLTLNNEDLSLILAKFQDPTTGDVNYPAFVQAVDREFEGHTMDDPDISEQDMAKILTQSKSGVTLIESPPVLFEDLMPRICHIALVNRLRVIDYFQDYDTLKSGSISISQFRRGLELMGLGHHELDDNQFAMLVQHYRNPQKPDQILWTKFLDDVERGIQTAYATVPSI